LNNFSWLLKQETQTFAIRHTVHHKPQMYMGNLRPMGAAPITFVLLVFLRWWLCGYRAICLCASFGLRGKIT